MPNFHLSMPAPTSRRKLGPPALRSLRKLIKNAYIRNGRGLVFFFFFFIFILPGQDVSLFIMARGVLQIDLIFSISGTGAQELEEKNTIVF